MVFIPFDILFTALFVMPETTSPASFALLTVPSAKFPTVSFAIPYPYFIPSTVLSFASTILFPTVFAVWATVPTAVPAMSIADLPTFLAVPTIFFPTFTAP